MMEKVVMVPEDMTMSKEEIRGLIAFSTFTLCEWMFRFYHSYLKPLFLLPTFNCYLPNFSPADLKLGHLLFYYGISVDLLYM